MPKLIDLGVYNALNEHKNISASRSYYKNDDAIDNVIRYITRTRENELKLAELIAVGGAGFILNAPVEDIINLFRNVQDFYDIEHRKGRRLLHYTYNFKDEEFYLLGADYALVDAIAREFSAYLFSLGFQSIYAIHFDYGKRVHIHFAINAINFLDGKKIHVNRKDFGDLEDRLFNYFYSMAEIVADKRGWKLVCDPIIRSLSIQDGCRLEEDYNKNN